MSFSLRVKNHDETKNSSFTIFGDGGVPGQTLNLGTYNYVSEVDTFELVGQNLDQYHKRKARGDLLPTTFFRKYSCQGAIKEGVYGWSDIVNGKCASAWCQGTFSAFYGTDTAWIPVRSAVEAYIPELDKSLVSEAYAKIYESKFDVLTFVAEITDVFGMVQNTILKLAKISLPKNWKSVPSGWLEQRYGWMPFISDLIAIEQALRSIEKRRTRFSEIAGQTYNYFSTSVVSRNDGNRIAQRIIADEVNIGVRGSVTADMDLPRFRLNPIATAWEKVPLSFCIDWLFDIGRTISVFSAALRTRQSTSAIGCSVKVVREASDEAITWTRPGCGSREVRTIASATAEYELRLPCAIPYLPSIRPKINIVRFIDSAALLSQRIKRRK